MPGAGARTDFTDRAQRSREPYPPHSLRHACLSRCRTDRVRAPPGRKTIDSRACILAVSPPFSKSFFLTRGCTRVPPYFAREEGKGEREGRERETFYFIMPASVIGIARRDRNRGPSRCGGPFKSIRNVGEMRILIIYRGQPTVADFFFFLFSFFFEGNMIGANCKAFLGQLLSLSLSVCLSLSFSDLTHLIWLVRMSVIYGFLLFWKVLWFL